MYDNKVIDVAFNLIIDNIELFDKLFKLLNIVFDVVFKLFIDNIDDVEKIQKNYLNYYLLHIVLNLVYW